MGDPWDMGRCRAPMEERGNVYLDSTAVIWTTATVKCYKCDWEGEESELVERPGNLQFYDNILKQQTTAEITRKEYACPRCGEMLKSKRFVDGIEFNR